MTSGSLDLRLQRARPLAPLLLALSYLLLIAAWVGGNPPGAAPDEPAHYVKALAAGGGDFLGSPLEHESLVNQQPQSALGSRQAAWQARTSRMFELPPALVPPPSLSCNAFLSEVSSACRDSSAPGRQPSMQSTYIGTYQPFLYVGPGTAARLAANPAGGVLLARTVGALLSSVLLVLAVVVLWDSAAGGVSLIGLMLAVTPMAVFLASTVSASGAEVTAGICYFAAVLRLARPRPATTTTWVALALGGATLALSRPLGPLWVALGAAVLPAVAGTRRSRAVARAGGARAFVAAGVITCAAAMSLAWQFSKQISPGASATTVVEGLVPSLRELPEMYRQHVGVFGWLDTQMPFEGYVVWTMALALLLGPAVVLGTWRQRVVLLALGVGSTAVCVGVSAALIRPTGFGMQARYVLPVAVVVPLFAGEILRLNRSRLPGWTATAALWLAGGFVSGVQLLSWYANARRNAVGTAGPWQFLAVAEWQPALGWLPWMLLAFGGSGLAFFAVVFSTGARLGPTIVRRLEHRHLTRRRRQGPAASSVL